VNLESGTFLGSIPYAGVARDATPILVLSGGQAFMQRQTPERIERERVAADHPGTVSDLVLLASAHRFSADGLRRVRRQIDRAAAADFAALGEDSFEEASLGRITAKTLLVSGTRDQLLGRVRERTAALVPGATLVQFPGETHMVPIERRRAVAARVRRVLSPRPETS
jgi:pimeloyl-ACP methyl ester carboxylesterase